MITLLTGLALGALLTVAAVIVALLLPTKGGRP